MHLRSILWGSLALIVLTIMWASIGGPVTAYSAQAATSSATYDPAQRYATVVPSPTNNGGSATWQIKTMSFVSKYPKGFDFVLDASSTGGAIVYATVVWRHSTIQPQFEAVKADPSGEYVAHWVPFADQNIPQWVGVDFWWTLTDAAGNTFQTPHGYAEYADNTRQWRRMVSEDVVVHWEASLPDDIGKEVIAAMRDQRATYLRDWGRLLDYKPQIVIYASDKPWQEWQPGVDLNSVEGETKVGWGTTVQIYSSDMPQPSHFLAYGVVLHEMEHLYQAVFGKLGVYPSALWFYEGDAVYLQQVQEGDYLQMVKELALVGRLPALQDLQNPGTDADLTRIAYIEGYAFWKWLETSYGGDAHRKVWGFIAQGEPIATALQLATGKPFSQLEAEFRTWLGAT
jgi:hypothetical protein